MNDKLKTYLAEKKEVKPVEFSTYVLNGITKAIGEWERKHKWTSGEQKTQFYKDLVTALEDYTKGMKRNL